MIKNTSNDFIYFDHASTTPLSETVKKIIQESLNEDWAWGNPSSLYEVGRKAKEKLEEARGIVAKCIGAEPNEIYFTSGATEGLNWIIKGAMDGCNNHILTSVVEHPAVHRTCEYLRGANHCGVTYCSLDKNGVVNSSIWEKSLLEHTYKLATAIHVNNEFGSINNIKQLAELSHTHGVPFLSDTTQSLGKVQINVKDIGVDYLVGSGHKFGTSHGVGFAYINKKSIIIPPPLFCGGAQERGERSGTENVLGVYCMAKALQEATERLSEHKTKIQLLKNHLIKKSKKFKEQTVIFNGNPLATLNEGIGIVNFSIPTMKLDGEALQLMLATSLPKYSIPIYVSTGSACSSNSPSAYRVLMALPGMDMDKAGKSIRVSFSSENTTEEIDYFIRKLKYILNFTAYNADS